MQPKNTIDRTINTPSIMSTVTYNQSNIQYSQPGKLYGGIGGTPSTWFGPMNVFSSLLRPMNIISPIQPMNSSVE